MIHHINFLFISVNIRYKMKELPTISTLNSMHALLRQRLNSPPVFSKYAFNVKLIRGIFYIQARNFSYRSEGLYKIFTHLLSLDKPDGTFYRAKKKT